MMVQPVDNWVLVGRTDHQPEAPAGAMAAAAAGMTGAGPNPPADLERLRELFSQFDRPFLERVYHECGGDLNRAIEHCLELTSRADSGAAGRTLPGASAPPAALSADQHHLVGADMAVDYKAITPGTPSMSGASTPVRTSAPWPGPSRGGSTASLVTTQLPPAVVEHRRAQLHKITTFLQSIGINGMGHPRRDGLTDHSSILKSACNHVVYVIIHATGNPQGEHGSIGRNLVA